MHSRCPHSTGSAGALLSEGELWRVTSKMHARINWCPHCEDKLWLSDLMCKYTSIPRWSHEQASNVNNFSHIISGSHGKVLCHAVHEGDTKKWQRVTTGKRWFLESINPKWSFILRAGLDIGETGWHLSYNGAWMMNKITGEFFLTKNGFSQSITVGESSADWSIQWQLH